MEILSSCAIFFIGLAPRLFFLSKGPFHHDTLDLMAGMRHGTITPHGIISFLPAFISIELARLRALFFPGVSDLAILQWTAALVASAAPAAAYLLFKDLFGRRLAAVYALLLSFMPVFFSVTTFGRIDAAFAFFFLPFCVSFGLQGRVFACALFLSLAMACRPECGFLLVGFFGWAVAAGRGRVAAELKRFLALAVLSLILWAGLGILLSRGAWLDGVFQKIILKQFGQKNPLDTLIILRLDAVKAFSSMLSLVPVIVTPLLCALIGIAQKIRERNFRLLALFLLPFFTAVILVMNMEVALNELRYLAVPFFFLFYFSACGIAAVFRSTRWTLAFALLVCVTMLAPLAPTLWGRHRNAYQVDFAAYVKEVTEPESIIITQDGWVFIDYYSERETLLPPWSCDEKEWLGFFAKVQAAVKADRPLYMTGTSVSYDYCQNLRNLIKTVFIVQRLDYRINEDWHPDTVGRRLYKEYLFRLVPTPRFFVTSKISVQ